VFRFAKLSMFYALSILMCHVFLVFMERVTLAAVFFVIAVLVAGVVLMVFLSFGQIPIDSASPIRYTYQIIKIYPHDTNAFTEGLVFDDGVLFESTGEYGSSSLRQVNLEDGVVQHEVLLPNQYFGEGLTVVNGSLVQLTWREKIGFIYDKENFGLLRNFSYSSEGWGLTFDGSKLILSDGTSKLKFLDPVTFQIVGQVSVHDGNTPVTNINELEYVNGAVYANIWMQQKIAIINPQTGTVKGWIDLTGICQSNNAEDVLNGIAYDQQTHRLYVTGKNWPNLYQITIMPKN
jgi:glutamine cyclotransferase